MSDEAKRRLSRPQAWRSAARVGSSSKDASDGPRVWTHVARISDAVQLAKRVNDYGRTSPIVCVTAAGGLAAPIIDMAMLAEAVGEDAEVVLLERGEPHQELVKRLPNALGPGEGTLRIWLPFADRGTRRKGHPSRTLLEHGATGRVPGWVRDELRRYLTERVPVPAKHETLKATVTRVSAGGAQFVLDSGRVAYADRLHITRVRGLPPERVLRPGQSVLVRVGEPAARPVLVTLLEHEPQLWERIRSECKPGRIIACKFIELNDTSLIVEILPGITGRVPRDEWDGHNLKEWLPEDHPVAVRIVNIDIEGRTIELSMRGIRLERDLPARALPLLPGGPAWLGETTALPTNDDQALRTLVSEGKADRRVGSEKLDAAIGEPSDSGPDARSKKSADLELKDRRRSQARKR